MIFWVHLFPKLIWINKRVRMMIIERLDVVFCVVSIDSYVVVCAGIRYVDHLRCHLLSVSVVSLRH